MKLFYLFVALVVSNSICRASNWFSPSQFTPDVTEIYKTADGQDLELYIFNPGSGDTPTVPTPTIVFFHGGGYTSGNPNVFFYACDYFASRGMIVMTARYRLNNTEGARRDGKSAMRYVIEHAARLGVDTALLAAGGGSAGGNLAVTLTDPNNHNEPTDNLAVSAAPDALVLFNPIGTGYGSTDMAPTIAQWGSEDTFISPAEALANQQDALNIGVNMEIEIYPGEAHSWYDNSREWITITLERADVFIEALGYVSGPPTVNSWIAVVNNDTGTQAPTVAFTSPTDGANFSEWSSLPVTVAASDPDVAGSIDNVRLYLDGVRVRIDSTAPYDWGPGSGETDLLLESLAPGAYELMAEAFDNDDYVARETITINMVDAPTEPPSAPTGLVAVPGEGGPFLDWDPNPEGDVSSYSVYRRTVGGSYGSPVLTNVSLDEVTDTSAQVGVTYFYRVSAVDTDGNESAPSAEIEVTVEAVSAESVLATDNAWVLAARDTAQNSKEDLEVNRGDWASFARSAFIRFPLSGISELGGFAPDVIDRISLDLYATATDADDPVRIYALLDGAQIAPAALSESTWTGGSDGTAGGGNNMINSNRPDVVVGGTAPPNIYTTIELGTLNFFSNVDDADIGLHRIEITEIEAFKQLLLDDTNQEITLILRADDGDQTTKFASLFNTAGNPLPTLSVFSLGEAAPPSPADLAATPSDGQVSLTWTADTVTNPVTYSVYRSSASGTLGSLIATGLATNSYLDDTAVNGTIYYYQVTATDGEDVESSPSNQVLAIPATAGNLAPSFDSDPIVEASIEIGESYSSTLDDDASDPESDPMIFTKLSGPTWLTVASDGSLSGTAPASAGLNSFSVQVDAAGGSDTATLEISVAADTTPPPVPSGLTATAGDGSVTLDWTANTDSDTATYNLYRSTTSDSYTTALSSGISGNSFFDDTAENGTTYYYVLTAEDASGNESAESSEVSATPVFVPDGTPPVKPTGLTATAGDTLLTLDWNDNSDLDLDSYRVYRSTTTGSFGSALVSDLSGSSYIDNTVVNGTTYYYVVTAVDTSDNESMESDETSATPAEVSASLLADYSFDGSSSVSFDSDANSVAGVITDGGGFGSSYETRTTGERGAPVPSLKWTVGDMNDGVLLDSDYLSFTITPEAGISLSFSEFSFTFKFPNAATQVALHSSQDGFTGSPVDTYSYPGGAETLTITLDLSSMAAAVSPVEFRLYLDTSASFGGAELWMDNIQLSGVSEIVVVDSDADEDGIDDSWEELYFITTGVIDGSLDSDGDGDLDFFEYLYGSVPNDATSHGFQLLVAPSQSGSNMVFEWSVKTGFTLGVEYDVEIVSDLGSPWNPLPQAHYSLQTDTADGKTEVDLTLTHDYGPSVFLRLIRP